MSHSHDAPSTRDLAGGSREGEPAAADAERAEAERTDTDRTGALGTEAERTDTDRTDAHGTEAERTDAEHRGADPGAAAADPARESDPEDQAARDDVGVRSGTVGDDPDAADSGDPTETVGEASAHERSAGGPRGDAEDNGDLLPADVDKDFQGRWDGVQARFVDDPRSAVEEADTLVASLMQQLADGFARERDRLESQWSRGEDVSTEDLRVVLQRYRSFFRRLLSA